MMLNEVNSTRRFKNLISTAQLVKKMTQHGYNGSYTEQAIYILLKKYGIKPKTSRGGKAYFNSHNACACIEKHIFELKELAEKLELQYGYQEEQQDDNVSYGRDDMSVASRELLANDGVFGADENELYDTTNESKKVIKISEDKMRLFEINNGNYIKKINITEEQRDRLFENSNDEGFRFGGMNNGNPSIVEFDPNSNGYSDTRIFKPNTKEFNIYYETLPNSGLKSINLYFLNNMNINKALKHGINLAGEKINVNNEKAKNSIDYFKKRSAYYITRILSSIGVSPEIFVTPQSSSDFNKSMVSLISSYYPNGNVLQMPNALKKNPYNIQINMNAAIELGMTQDDINKLQNKIENIKKDEDIRGFRKKVESLKSEIASMMTGMRGRPKKEVSDKRKEIDAYNTLIKANRRRGRDSTIDSAGNIKPMQIKNLDDRQRRALDGLFVFNDIDYPSTTYSKGDNEYTISQSRKIYGKIVVVFDDNLSSGATLDMACSALKKMGAKMIIPITLGVIPLTSYDKQSRQELIDKRKMRH